MSIEHHVPHWPRPLREDRDSALTIHRSSDGVRFRKAIKEKTSEHLAKAFDQIANSPTLLDFIRTEGLKSLPQAVTIEKAKTFSDDIGQKLWSLKTINPIVMTEYAAGANYLYGAGLAKGVRDSERIAVMEEALNNVKSYNVVEVPLSRLNQYFNQDRESSVIDVKYVAPTRMAIFGAEHFLQYVKALDNGVATLVSLPSHFI